MSKRRQGAEANLPLFDLPLQPPEDAAPTVDVGGDRPAASTARTPEQPDLTPRRDLEPAPAAAHASPAAGPEGLDSQAFEALDASPLVQDRLLSGLADVVLLSAAVGAMVLAAQLMDVRVTAADGLPFAVFALLLSFPYTVVPLAFWGRTPGMAWVGHVARSDADEALTFAQTTRRWLGAVLTVALAGLPLLLSWNGGRSLADRFSDSMTLQRS